MDRLNIRRPSIEPRATGHVIEQIGIARKILENGYGYEVDGSIYFDLDKYAKEQPYGQLSGKVLEDLQSGSRNTEGLEHKRGPHDFALWKHAKPEHIMRWESPWGEGFPGWHLECSVMSHQYLGDVVDIHGGGMDLQFPHHEAEIAQNYAAWGEHTVRYWMHNNMLTIDGQKMARSLGNFITLTELFSGAHELLEQAYSPMTVRFFMLQAHYRSPIDFSNTALQAAEKGYKRLMNALETLQSFDSDTVPDGNNGDPAFTGGINAALDRAHRELSDDFNTANALASLFELVGRINDLGSGKVAMKILDAPTFARLAEEFPALIVDVLGLQPEERSQDDLLDGVLRLLIDQRTEAKAAKDWATADRIRDDLASAGIMLKDSPEGTSWTRK
jgi:cysteinyl-tRNA synthetase